MNQIEVKYFKTRYAYEEVYWVIDGRPITEYLDKYLSWTGSSLGLLPAWSGMLISQWENDFVWELIDSQEELNVPILVCEDDCDLSCIVILAHIRRDAPMVCWDRIGLLSHAAFVLEEYNQSGILCLESYTDQDWAAYGSNIALEPYGSPEYWNWVSEHCYEEQRRRLHNYFKPYMQKEQNIEWIWEPKWKFAAENYREMEEQYRALKRTQDAKNGLHSKFS